jgi:progressive ankylosis protein
MADTLQLRAEPSIPILTQRRILFFWLPLASSWLLMTSEIPFISAAIARLPNAQTMIAAFGITTSISITIESPVIMLLATATALASHRQAYFTLRRFTWHLLILVTLAQALISFTPLYDILVRGWMGIPAPVADAAQPGLQIMTLWSAFIGWRRFKQGVMIRFGHTRLIGVGTFIRLAASGTTAVVLALLGTLPGVALGAIALMFGVLAEMLYTHIVANRIINQHLAQPDPAQPPLSYKALAKYHSPLAAVSLLTLLGQPLIGAALARAASPEQSLAAWPVVIGLIAIFRSPAYALPEAVIALQKTPGAFAPLRRFCITAGLVASALVLVLGLTPLGAFYFNEIIHIAPLLTALALPGVLLGVAVPFISAIQSYWRGVLMGAYATAHVYMAMMINLVTLAAVLTFGVWQHWPGVQLGMIALTLSLVTESAYLAWRVNFQSIT